jgi:maltokinase
VAYDALTDPAMVAHLAERVGLDMPADWLVRAVGAEQSNSSVILGDQVIVKLYRRLQHGPNPDIEMVAALDEVGFNHVAPPMGSWRRGDLDLAVAQELLKGGTEGWALALTSLRDLLAADGDLDPAAAGGDFASEAHRLGEMTARLHLSLSAAFGVHDSNVDAWVAAIERRAHTIPGDPVQQSALDRATARVIALPRVGPSIRVHGDFHLGQVMRTDVGWFVFDFEGEPGAPLAERREPWPALRDVAGMLRSFDYAAAVAIAERDEPHRDELATRGRAWEARNRAAFLDGYLATEQIGALLPDGGSAASVNAMLGFFELEKALYELSYERAHRPDWAGIPSQAIERMVAAYDAAESQQGDPRSAADA